MALNIKSEKVHGTALEVRLQNELKKRGEPKAEQILEFASRFVPGIDPNFKSIDQANFLYGEDGLPH